MPKPAPAPTLSAQDREILRLVRQGCRNSEIAGNLSLSIDGVTARLTQLAQKLSARDRLELAICASHFDSTANLNQH